MTELLLVMAMGALDRWRGDAEHLVSRTAEKALYGYAVAILAGHPFDPLTIGIVAAMMLGMSPGWGEPLGALIDNRPMVPSRLEWWQRGSLLRNSDIAALISRGAIWSAPVLPLMYFDPDLLSVFVAFLVAVPVAPYLFRHWEIQEFARGGIAGLVIAATA